MSDSNVDHVLVYKDRAGEWRWSGVAGNGEIVAEGESHSRVDDAARAAHGVLGVDVPIVLAQGAED